MLSQANRKMRMNKGREQINFLIPQILTGFRVVLGGLALFQAIRGQAHWAATWITYGALTDGLDGIAARRLKATSDFGAAFDLFSDYLCYIVAPVALSLHFFGGEPGAGTLIILGLPLLAGAIRYSRNIGWGRTQLFETVGIPGLATVIYSFCIVTLYFSKAGEVIGTEWIRRMLLILVPMLSGLMVSTIRFSKLMKHHWIFFPVMIGFLVMPFAFTQLFASIAFALGFVYTVLSPILIHARQLKGKTPRYGGSFSQSG
jgi:CDP-diacylglycerol---serine O-phosphatidyltransferase